MYSLGYSQISLNSSHFPIALDSILLTRAVVEDVDFNTTGPDHSWDFSSLQFQSSVYKQYGKINSLDMSIQLFFGQYANVKYKSTYFTPTTEIAFNNLPPQVPLQISDVNDFHKIAEDSMTSVGMMMKINGNTVPIKKDTIEKMYQFPLEYGNTYSSRGYLDFDMNPIFDARWKQAKQRQSEVDGWGTVKTPYGEFEVLRIHHTITEMDSIYVTLFGFSNWFRIPIPTRHEYEWRSTTEKEPILLIKTTENNGNQQISSIEYRDDTHLSTNKESIETAIYPNPVTDMLAVESEANLTHYEVYSAGGKLVQYGNLASVYQNLIDFSSLNTGHYIMKLFSDKGMSVQKISKL